MVMEVRAINSAFQELVINYEETKSHPIGKSISSPSFMAGGHMWIIECFPRGNRDSDEGKYLSIFVELVSNNSSSVNAIFEFFFIGKDGQPSSTSKRTDVHRFQRGTDWGWAQFVSHTDLVNEYVVDGHIRIMCAVVIVDWIYTPALRSHTGEQDSSSIPVLPSDIGKHLGTLLDSADGTDVSFIVDGETFRAHRAVLAARSPVFKAELLGSMAEAAMPSITLRDISPATFRAMLRFIYTDVLPEDDELVGGSPSEMMQRLLAAADRYALDRLKSMCAQRLWSDVSVGTVASTLALAEMHNCLELKKQCITFFASEKNFRKAVLTPGFLQLVQQFPSIIGELREKTET